MILAITVSNFRECLCTHGFGGVRGVCYGCSFNACMRSCVHVSDFLNFEHMEILFLTERERTDWTLEQYVNKKPCLFSMTFLFFFF